MAIDVHDLELLSTGFNKTIKLLSKILGELEELNNKDE